jgi:hypothetical protein
VKVGRFSCRSGARARRSVRRKGSRNVPAVAVQQLRQSGPLNGHVIRDQKRSSRCSAAGRPHSRRRAGGKAHSRFRCCRKHVASWFAGAGGLLVALASGSRWGGIGYARLVELETRLSWRSTQRMRSESRTPRHEAWFCQYAGATPRPALDRGRRSRSQTPWGLLSSRHGVDSGSRHLTVPAGSALPARRPTHPHRAA